MLNALEKRLIAKTKTVRRECADKHRSRIEKQVEKRERFPKRGAAESLRNSSLSIGTSEDVVDGVPSGSLCGRMLPSVGLHGLMLMLKVMWVGFALCR